MTGFVIVDGVERDEVEWLQEERRRLMTELAAERERLVREGVFTYDGRIMLVRSEEDAAKTVAAERERCERVLLALLHESYSMTGPACVQRALAAIRKG